MLPWLLRGSVATEYYKASGGDIVVTQDVLNHVRVDTTELYIKGPQTRRVQSEAIARLQDLMLGWIIGMHRWAGGKFHPESCNLDDINKAIAKALRLSKGDYRFRRESHRD